MVNIRFVDLKINSVSNSSGVFSGTNILCGWKNEGKSNAGFGSVGSQYNTVHGGVHVVFDQDVLDQWLQKDRHVK